MTYSVGQAFSSLTWEEAAEATARKMLVRMGSDSHPIDAVEMIGKAIEDRLKMPPFLWFRAVAELAFPHTLLTTAEIVDLVIDKQRDYGHDNILRFGVEGIQVRISDKQARLENLLCRRHEPTNEATFDSWTDIVGYCIIGTMLVDGTFTLPLASDVPELPSEIAGKPIAYVVCENDDYYVRGDDGSWRYLGNGPQVSDLGLLPRVARS